MLVFVYGTLRQGDCRAGALADYPEVELDARVQGFRMLNLGAFPGIIPGEGEIKGEVYEIDAACLRLLDGIEGYREDDPENSLYRREKAMSYDSRGKEIGETYLYVFNRPSRADLSKVITSGDWLQPEPSLQAQS